MKKITCLLLLIFTTQIVWATNPKDHYDDYASFHGMILFGQGDDFYISHLPMWMNPHDYQMVLKVKISDAIKEKISKLQSEGISLFSLAPNDSFVLPKLAGGDVSWFEAEIYKGHFERDGEEIGTSRVEYEQLILFKKLKKDEASPAPNKQKYVLFGNDKNQYMVHIAHGYPEIDEILRIQPQQDPEIKMLLDTSSTIGLICNTKDTEKNMDGLDETLPQDCEVNKEHSCEECENTLGETTAASSVESKLPSLFNKVMIETNIYTDTNDLGSGH